jgi:hypothetical protein
MDTKENPAVQEQGDNGKSITNNSTTDIENLLETSFNKNDYQKIVELIRQETVEAFRNKYTRIVAEKLSLSFGDVLRDVENKKPQQEQIKLSEKLRSHHNIVTAVDAEMKYVIDKLLPESCILELIGRRGKKKSIIAMRMAIDIATGSYFLLPEWKATPHQVIYADMENPIQLIKKRLKLMSENDNIPNLSFLLRQDIMSIDIEKEEHMTELAELVKDKVIVFDTLSKIHKRDENSNPHMNIVFGHLLTLARQHAKAIILLHHQGKGENLGGRGASAIEDNPDIVIEISSDDNFVNHKCTKHRDGRESDYTKLLSIEFTERIKITDITQEEFNIFYDYLRDEYKQDNSIFETQSKIIEAMAKHGYSKEKTTELLSETCDYGLLGWTKGENNSKKYFWK